MDYHDYDDVGEYDDDKNLNKIDGQGGKGKGGLVFDEVCLESETSSQLPTFMYILRNFV